MEYGIKQWVKWPYVFLFPIVMIAYFMGFFAAWFISVLIEISRDRVTGPYFILRNYLPSLYANDKYCSYRVKRSGGVVDSWYAAFDNSDKLITVDTL